MLSLTSFIKLFEASYSGNIGVMELIKFYNKAPSHVIKQVKDHIANKKNKEAWDIVQDHLGVKLHGSVHEDLDEAKKVWDKTAGQGKPIKRVETVHKVGDKVMCDQGQGTTAYGIVKRLGATMVHVKHNDGSIAAYHPKHVDKAEGYWDRERDKEDLLRKQGL